MGNPNNMNDELIVLDFVDYAIASLSNPVKIATNQLLCLRTAGVLGQRIDSLQNTLDACLWDDSQIFGN
jgi:hypothetical protein|tara:strand:- start:361 stop:567 length:207 start_codon:yes stop_codon:yes gene_type:complete